MFSLYISPGTVNRTNTSGRALASDHAPRPSDGNLSAAALKRASSAHRIFPGLPLGRPLRGRTARADVRPDPRPGLPVPGLCPPAASQCQH
jgi:hypothetical protein